jgi:glycine/D-amino acid oxidase-like deaminating enzyme
MKSVWHENAETNNYPELQEDIKTDVLIIGGGIAGLLTAYTLEQRGVDCVVVEKGRVLSGNTQNTTAKITFQHGLIYHKILKSYGKEKAAQYLLANKSALDRYRLIAKETDCDFECKDNYVYSTDDREKLEKELDALSEIGYDAEFVDSVPLPVDTVGAVCFRNQAQFNPLKFLYGISKNLNIFENTFVKEMQGNVAVTDKGKIVADNVVVATHFPFINKHGSYFLKLYQHRSYVIALENAQNVDGMYVDEADKGLSFRNYGDMLLLGGGDHRTGKNGGNWAELRSLANKHYPSSQERFYWSAQDCMSLDGIPYIGNYSKTTPNLYVISGFNKWGMTSAMVSADIISDMIESKLNEYQDVFSPSRSILKPQLFVNAFESAVNLLTPTTKRCPHLGCALKWNKAEHSWDCPCHGSRFDETGKVLDNPANGSADL